MKKQTVIWTALPNGKNGDKLKLSIFVSPQLFSDAASPTLSLFSDWTNWTARMRAASFKIGFKDPLSAAPDVILDATVTTTDIDPPHWTAIFGPSTWVKPFEHQDYPDRMLRSYPIRNILKHIRSTYAEVAVASPGDKPSPQSLHDRFKDFCFYEIPVRQRPKKTKVSSATYSQGNQQSSQAEDRPYKRRPFGTDSRRSFYASLDQTLSAFLPREELKKKNSKNYDAQSVKFRERIKQDYLFLAQDPTTKLCNTAGEGLRRLYSQLAEFQAVPPSEPNTTMDFLQMSLFYKPRNKFNENYLATSWLRSQKKSGSPFYYVGAKTRDGGADSKELYSADRKMSGGAVKPYTSDLMHEGEVNPYAFANTTTPKFDFHNILNALNRYPWLLRKLGIAMDVEVPATSVPTAILSKPCYAYVIPSFVQDTEPGVPKTNFTPRTAYYLDATMFTAAPKDSVHPESLHGLLTVGSTDYFDVVTLEPGGSALKMLNTVNNLSRSLARFSALYLPEGWDTQELNPESPDNDSDAALPALRSHGIGISRHGLAYSIVNTLQRGKSTITKLSTKQAFIAANNIAAANAVDATNVLYAEDITRGWRADYYDMNADSPQWRSLMKRDGKYHFLNDATLDENVSDEGFVSPSASQSSDGSSDDLYTGEMLFEWSGWSLVTPRPAKTLTKDEMHPDGSPDLQDPNSSPVSPDGTHIKATFLPTGRTLPRLRYGHAYKVRARTVDMAGNSWDLSSAPSLVVAPKTETAPVKFLRHDVIKTPLILLRDALTKKDGSGNTVPLSHAETVEQMVVRSNRDKTTAEFSAAHPPFKEDTVRYLTAPKVDYTFAETHGVFDKKYIDTQDWTNLYSVITKRDYQLSNASDGGYTCFKSDEGTKDTILVGSFQLPYLPDPLAKGIVLRGLPGTRAVKTGAVITQHAKMYLFRSDGSSSIKDDTDDLFPKGLLLIEFAHAHNAEDWVANYPHDAYITIRLVERGGGDPAEPKWDSGTQTLTVRIEKSDVWRVAYSSLLEPQDVKKYFALHTWLDDIPNGPQKERALRHMESSAHWMLTPYRNLMLTHAVQQPLKDPAWYKQSLQRSMGLSTALLKDPAFVVHGKSTVKVDFSAFWELQVDDTTFDLPQDITSDIYDASKPEMKDRQAQKGSMHVGDINVDKRNATDINVSIAHDYKDTLHRYVEYEPLATTRFREYFPQTGYDFTVKGTRWKKHVVSTKRPDALKLQYIVPVFAWATDSNSAAIIRTRMAGLRVYMDRPWFSSGNDEKLGVVLAPIGSNPEFILGSPISKLVTMWGYDPIWLSKPTPSELFPLSGFFLTKSKDLSQSPMKQGVVQGVTYDELSSNPTTQQQFMVDVACHDVFYDSERKLWYSDIMLAHGESYFPFIRMALCRVQPYSLRDDKQDVFMSRVTQADYMQIMPLRKTTVNFDTANTKSLRISVEGVSYRASHVGVIESEIELTLEEQAKDMGADFGWTQVSTIPLDRVNAGVLGGYWGGVLNLPKERIATKYRLVVREYEQLHADLIMDSAKPLSSDLIAAKGLRSKVERRIVFADVIEI